MDIYSKKKRSEIMSKVRSKDSKLEIEFRKKLWKVGFRYCKNSSKYFGKPDLVLSKYKAVIFVDSCFWHGCKRHGSMPNTRKRFWQLKLARNVERDREVTKYYKKIGWKIFRIWEHQLKNGQKIIDRIIQRI
ncbi:MAG: very short patch repair endonuclease [Candidatus Paceibacterota bacterium]|jgi:DNA mismatch endonuclease (patch repair protein)